VPADGLIRAALGAARDLGPRTRVVAVPLPRHPELPQERRAELVRQVALAYGATQVVTQLPALDASLREALESSTPLPPGVAAPVVERELRRSHPATTERGAVVLFTGFSGSGKSTIARGVYDALLERGDRTVTLLDGDVVRRLLSAGLGFSREDRDLNVRRIGYVASLVARHGGIALCAPIAPYADSRAAVRALAEEVGAFVLVHVATPLEVCEARDRKGLYAKARAGLLPAFTGVDDPYEEPVDADLVLDTTDLPSDRAIAAVIQLLESRGLLPPAPGSR
jgi:sulfate adenylyltransferase